MDKRVIDRLEEFVHAVDILGAALGDDRMQALKDLATVRYWLEQQDRQREKTARDVLAASSNEDVGRAVRAALVAQYTRNGTAKVEPVAEKYAETQYPGLTYEQISNLRYGRWSLTRTENCELRWLRCVWAELKGCHMTGSLSALDEIMASRREEETMMLESTEGEHGVLKDKKQETAVDEVWWRNAVVVAAKAWLEDSSARNCGALIDAVRGMVDCEKD